MRQFYSRKLPYVNLTIVAVNILYFVILEMVGTTYSTDFMERFGALYGPAVVNDHQYYRLLTSVFMHFGIEHIANNMLILLILGDHLERAMGRIKYLILYLACGVGANMISLMTMGEAEFESVVSAGASGAVFGVMGGLIYVVAVNRGRLEDLNSRQLAVIAVLSLYFGFIGADVNNMAHVAGLLIGIVAAGILYWKPKCPSDSGFWYER